ncbi:hypothetical protein [Plastoroseomonas arctica]|uniref:Lectin n=1 Tax=Plastoroseomonas arctica TaxID=1509237 RepID=A0AAF1K6D3_9PROT|nr:hypothetical protein [Plastoroseomonas arctica]MBR0657303.1 hypothetical protein [Plastoroseomonas arctica]
MRNPILLALALVPLALAADAQAPAAQPAQMTFFVTSTPIGRGADLGGIAGADAHCQTLAQAAGAGQRRWHAYLSTQGAAAINARDRIGAGPWRNVMGVVIADNLATLHGENNLTKATALTERGAIVNGRGDTPNTHDIVTGSQPDGTAYTGTEDMTCRNWTHSGTDGAAMVGHADRIGLRDDAASRSWTTSHPSRGCTQANLVSTGGAGLLYCFAVD